MLLNKETNQTLSAVYDFFLLQESNDCNTD